MKVIWNYATIVICMFMVGLVQSQTCEYLDQTAEARLFNPCVYVVDYAFYLPKNITADELRVIANGKLNNSLLLELPTTCTAALVSYACSLIYLKCLPQYVSSKTTSTAIYLNDTGLPIPLPIERPCVSVCNAVQTYCSTSPLYKATQSYPNCFAKYNYASLSAAFSKPYQFDLKNSASCYVTNVTTNAYITETYVRNGSYSPCAGIVDTFINPPGTKINSSYTTLQLPYTYQDTVNSQLLQVSENLPKWISADCRLAAMKYFCYRFFFKPEAITFGAALTESMISAGYPSTTQTGIRTVASATYPGLLTTTLYFPSYANRSFCSSYGDTCASFLTVADNAALNPNCTLESYDSFIFPDNVNQTGYSLSVKVSTSTIVVSFITQPDYGGYYNSSEYATYEPTCPQYYVIPENPDGKEVDQVSGSVCAVGCQPAIWTASEWSSFADTAMISSAISLALGLVLLIFIAVMQDWKQSYLIFMSTIFAVMNSASLLHLHAGTTFEERFCYDNAQSYSQQTDATSSCTQVAIVTTYCFLCGITTMFVLSVHRVLSLQGDKDHIINHMAYIPVQMAFIFLPPIIPVVYGAVKKYFGYSGIQPWCFFRSYPNIPQNEDVYWLGFPVLVVAFFTYSLLIISEIIFIVQRVRGPVSNSSIVQDESAVASPTDGGVEMVAKFDDNINESNVLGASTLVTDISAPQQSTTAAQLGRTPRVELVQGIVVLVSIIIAAAFVASRIQVYEFAKPYVDSFTDYTKCVFKNYDGTKSYMDDCGEHPGYRPKEVNVNIFIIVVFSANIIITPAYFIAYWSDYLFVKKDAAVFDSRTVADSSAATIGDKNA